MCSSEAQWPLRRVLASALVSGVLVSCGWVGAQIRSDAAQDQQIASIREQVQQLNKKVARSRPADELVSQDQFVEFSRNVLCQLEEIKAELIRQRTWRMR